MYFFVHRSPLPTVIVFTKADWQEVVQGDLGLLKPVRIFYDQDRLQDGTGPVIAEIKYNENGKVHSLALQSSKDNSSMLSAEFTITRTASVLIIWFKREKDGAYYYDSDYGNNYKFLFNQIVFAANWHEYVNGHLSRGGDFDVVYYWPRLSYNPAHYPGRGKGYFITAHVKFSDHGQEVKKVFPEYVEGFSMVNTRFHIPNDAPKIIMWFTLYRYNVGSDKFDSNHGANYHFKVF